jgi:hypothetical protein
MHPAHPPDGLDAGAEVKMIGIAEQNLDAEVFEYVLGHTFHGRESSDWHEHRGLNLAVRGGQAPRAGWTLDRFNLKLDRHWKGF